ncbi:sn-glycerol-3-phosphate ABC transporter ATP-binding protein UgpC [Castellaniella sp. FW104-16D08]|uniref:ABC transporter ATP-binding protein n=1 Tax=unclassified Castellaniella TaxID=2617606 RepID=UPI003315AAE4
MAKVTVDKLCKSYDGSGSAASAVQDFSIEIQDGELIVLVGPSGCGKSTSLRMLAGLESVTSGTITIGDQDVTHLPPKDRNIAMVFQNYALYPQKTVYENLAFGLYIRGEKAAEIEKRVLEVAKSLDLQELLKRRPRQLSGGQRQRVALGRALIRNPACFLLDEPLSNLDAKLRVKMREEISALHARLKATMIYVTHDQVEAMTLGDRIVVMRGGIVQQIGKPLTLYDEPASLFVATFIGSPEMNLIPCTLSEKDGRLTAQGGALSIEVPADSFAHIEPEATLGIRPEHIVRSERPDAAELAVSLVEQLGSQTYLLGDLHNARIRAVFPRDDTIRPGDKVRIEIPGHKIHLFSGKTGKTLKRTERKIN